MKQDERELAFSEAASYLLRVHRGCFQACEQLEVCFGMKKDSWHENRTGGADGTGATVRTEPRFRLRGRLRCLDS